MRWRRRDCAWIAAAAVDRSMSYSVALLMVGFFGGGGGAGLLLLLSWWLWPWPRRESGLPWGWGFSTLGRDGMSRLGRL